MGFFPIGGTKAMNLITTKADKLLAVGLLVVAALSAGCGGGGGGASGKIAYLNFDNTDAFGGKLIREEVKRGVDAKNLDVEFFDAKGDRNTQIDQMKEAIDSGAEAIVLLAIDGDGIIPIVEQANAANIPVVTVNRDANGGDRARVYSDEYEAGKLQAEFMLKNLPTGANIVYLEGTGNLGSSQQRWEGFRKECVEKRSDIKLLDMQDGRYSRAEAMKIMAMWLSIFPKIDAVICGNDQMAFGAIDALKRANRLEGCMVSGVDAVDEALEAIEKGEMVQTIKQDGIKQAQGVVTNLEAIHNGQKPSDIVVPFTSITKDNLNDFRK